MTTRNTAASIKRGKLRKRIVRAFLSGIIAATGGQRDHAKQPQRRPTRDERELDQRVRECGEW
jgi:hypothetical protein